MARKVVKAVDATLGAVGRAWLRHMIVHPLLVLLYRVEVRGMDAGLSIKDGGIVVARHVSRMDPALLMDAAWPFARVRPTAWWQEYDHPLQKWAMVLFGAVRLGSDRSLPSVERRQRTLETKGVLSKLLRGGWGLLIFPEGGIGNGDVVTIPPGLTGVHDLVAEHPDKPVLLVQVEGLERSRFGKKRPCVPWWKRLHVVITLTRVDRFSIEGGPEGVNARLEKFFQDETVELSAP